MKHLLSVADLGRDGLEDLLSLTDSFMEVSTRQVPKVPALVGKTVVSLFYEDSTRTRLSFETAARRLSADVMTFGVSSSSVNKGESIRDTVETIEAMGIDALVVRHKAAGVPVQISRLLEAHEHILKESRKFAGNADDAGDDGTNDLLVGAGITVQSTGADTVETVGGRHRATVAGSEMKV